MTKSSLPLLKRKHHPNEHLVPVATAHAAPAAHLMNDRNAEPTFDDLIAGNHREPSHADLLAVVDETPAQDADRKFKSAYPGAAADALAWLRSLDDADRPPVAPIEEPPAMPLGNPRLLFDALDALDQLPALHGTDDAAFQLATNAAAVLTYAALRPDLLTRHEIRMQLAPLAAELAEVAR